MNGSAAPAGEPGEAGVLAAVHALRRGGLVAAATETQIGLLADARDAAALRRLSALKRRPPDRPFPLLVPGLAVAAGLVREIPALARRLADAFWPGPLTLLLPAGPGLPEAVVAPDGTVAVRVPGPSAAATICARFAGPLVATSANRRGFPPPGATEDLDPAVAAAIDVVVPGRAPGTLPSTIVEAGGAGYRIVRAGAIDDERIRRLLA
jgi:L-threonylcarbamoyladenylate synthase